MVILAGSFDGDSREAKYIQICINIFETLSIYSNNFCAAWLATSNAPLHQKSSERAACINIATYKPLYAFSAPPAQNLLNELLVHRKVARIKTLHAFSAPRSEVAERVWALGLHCRRRPVGAMGLHCRRRPGHVGVPRRAPGAPYPEAVPDSNDEAPHVISAPGPEGRRGGGCSGRAETSPVGHNRAALPPPGLERGGDPLRSQLGPIDIREPGV
mmetsp:Transcript_42531/g.136454  ORF Transcript_42531/g.136454 Transcript_42531/m.136454 type:complete len:215 (+) Transcript_42531:59-703(+)